jgi:3-hydroxyisobutyrate dehydrogenase-like beta-hydroxyacid dehydrogenase
MARERIGFIGIGNMGGPMASHVRRAGYELTVCDPSPATHAPLVELGAKVVSSAKEVADSSDIVFACLPSPKVSIETAKIVAGCPSVKSTSRRPRSAR